MKGDTRPVILDGCCGAGGASAGYAAAGFRVIGVDHNPQPDYPFQFIQSDVLTFLSRFGGDFEYRHASFPCQAHTTLAKGNHQDRRYPDLIPDGVPLMLSHPGVSVIENVPGAPIRGDLTLCGESFGLDVIRHRKFQIDGAAVPRMFHVKHRGRVEGWRHGQYHTGPYVSVYGHGGGKGSVAQWQSAMGIHWTKNRKSIAEAIPPAYTEYIGRHLLGTEGGGT